MGYIEIDKSIREKGWSMSNLHSHAHYEIYSLRSGTRNFFLKDEMYKITAPCIIIISPYTMHKTDGDGFSRININITEDSLSDYQKSVLNKLTEKILPLNQNSSKLIFELLEEASLAFESNDANSREILKTIVSYIIVNIDKISKTVNTVNPIMSNNDHVPPIVLKIINYVGKNYKKKITLDELSSKFYISRTSLCSAFKEAMGCTLGEYLTRIRINQAKKYLSSSNKSIEEISTLCGFESPAYFGIAFKNKVKLSPLQYRKQKGTK